MRAHMALVALAVLCLLLNLVLEPAGDQCKGSELGLAKILFLASSLLAGGAFFVGLVVLVAIGLVAMSKSSTTGLSKAALVVLVGTVLAAALYLAEVALCFSTYVFGF